MIGLDTTFLIDLYWKNSPRHLKVVELLNSFSQSNEELNIYYNCFNEFIHVITDTHRFEDAFTMEEALAVAEEWRDLENVKILFPDDQSYGRTLTWLEIFKLGRKRLNDTNMASCYELAGVTKLFTANPDDFKSFEGIEAVSY